MSSGRPSAFVDWSNNYGDDPDRCVFFHRGKRAKHAAMNASHCAGILAEAMDTYLGWTVHRHS